MSADPGRTAYEAPLIAWSADGQNGSTADGYRIHIGPGGYTQRPHIRIRTPGDKQIATTLGDADGLPEAQREAGRLIAEDRDEVTGGRAA